VGVGRRRDARDAGDAGLGAARVVEEDLVADPHVLEHEVARLEVAHAEPGGGLARSRGEVVDAELVRLGFHQPERHDRVSLRRQKRKRRLEPAFSSDPAASLMWSPPSAPLEPIPEPIRSKVVAFRSHQVHPTRDARNSDARVCNLYQSVGSRIFRVLAYTTGDNSSGAARPVLRATEREPDRASPPSRPFYA